MVSGREPERELKGFKGIVERHAMWRVTWDESRYHALQSTDRCP